MLRSISISPIGYLRPLSFCQFLFYSLPAARKKGDHGDLIGSGNASIYSLYFIISVLQYLTPIGLKNKKKGNLIEISTFNAVVNL